jgi:hypothetical protein
MVDGVPTYKPFIHRQWVRSARNAVVDDFNPSTGMFTSMQSLVDTWT